LENAFAAQFHLVRVTAEFLTESHRHGILQMRSPDFEDFPELRTLAVERVLQDADRGDEFAADDFDGGNVQGSRKKRRCSTGCG
jgi:hypothetical protein